MKFGIRAGVIAPLVVVFAGCATVTEPPDTVLKSAQKPSWSAKAIPAEMIVDVSPAGDTLRIAGSAGMVIGSGADAVVNARYRGPIRDALEGYDAAAVFADKIQARMEGAVGQSLEQVSPLGSTAGVDSRRDAQELRYERLSKDGYDAVLDIITSFGIFGAEGMMAVELDGKLLSLPDTQTIWDNKIAVSTAPVLADAKLQDPTKRMGLNLTNPSLTVDGEAVRAWTEDGGTLLKQRFEATADAAVSALVCDLGLAREPIGEYYLGTLSMNRKDFDEAETHFAQALALDAGNVDARNARAVNRWHNKERDRALSEMRALANDVPDFGPAHYNLAFWLAVEMKDGAAGKEHYEKARALGMPESKKIEKAIEKNN
jgi:tetratricopeptide (TPR) repeat protein